MGYPRDSYYFRMQISNFLNLDPLFSFSQMFYILVLCLKGLSAEVCNPTILKVSFSGPPCYKLSFLCLQDANVKMSTAGQSVLFQLRRTSLLTGMGMAVVSTDNITA